MGMPRILLGRAAADCAFRLHDRPPRRHNASSISGGAARLNERSPHGRNRELRRPRLRRRRRQGDRARRCARDAGGAWLPAPERRRHLGRRDQRGAARGRLHRRGAARDHHRPRLPAVPGQGLGGQGAADRALAEHAARPRPLRGRRLPRVDPRAARGQGGAHVRRPRPSRVRRRPAVPLPPAGGRIRRDQARAARPPPRRDQARDRAGRPRRRARRADEHEHPRLLRAGPVREPEDRRDARDRRRRHALELPGLAVRLRRRHPAGLADLRHAARRAEAAGSRSAPACPSGRWPEAAPAR